MITKFQRHPTDGACVILHVTGILASVSATGNTIEITNQAYRDALEAAGKLED